MTTPIPDAVRPSPKLSPRATRAWQLLRSRATVHCTDCKLDIRAFEDLQRCGLAAVTRLPHQQWVAELGPAHKEILEVTVPTGAPEPPSPVDDDLLRLRIRSEPLRVVGQVSRGHHFDIEPVLDDGDLVGWAFRTLHPSGSGLVYGWVSVDAQACSSWSTARQEAASELRTAHREEAAHSAAARAAAVAVHPGPHCFQPVYRQEQLLGYTLRLALRTTGACTWVTSDGSVVARRILQYREEAAAALTAYLDTLPGLSTDEDARAAARRSFPQAYNLLRAYQCDDAQQLLGWIFCVPDERGRHRFGWIATTGRTCAELTSDRPSACGYLAGEHVLNTPWTTR